MSEGVAAAAVPAACRTFAFDGGGVREEQRIVANEAAVQVILADTPFAVMMLTPADLEDFAYGFGLTEGLIDGAADIRDLRIEAVPDGIALHVGLSGDRLRRQLARQRAMVGRTGCGVCGIDDLAALKRAGTGPAQLSAPVAVAAVARALRALDERQVLNSATRAVHAAAWADADGRLLHVREDVGRHNALDKLIGACLRSGTPPSNGFALITSRCSFEMVEKVATFGAGLVVAISAPTALAIRRAEALGVALCAIARRDSFTVFTGFDRIREGERVPAAFTAA